MEDTSDINLGLYNLDTLNPLATKSESVQKIMNIVYEPLFTLDANMNITPVLAKDYSLSQDGRQITVNLNENIKWQDGTNFTADDVIYTLSKMRTVDGLYKKISDEIKSFTAVSKTQVQINLECPTTDFAYSLTFPIIKVNTPFVIDAGFTPMGTGSYKFVSKNSTSINLEPNSIWHGQTVSKKKIVVKILKDKDSVANAFNVNEIDAITSDEINIETTTPKGNSTTKEYVSNNMVFLGFNVQKVYLATSNVRQAINHLIDKQDIVDNYVYGHGKISDLSINPSSWAYTDIDDTNLPQGYIENLFAKDGYALNKGIYYKDGRPLALDILVNNDNQQKINIANRIADTLKTAGISTYVSRVSYEDYLKRISSDEFDVFVGEVLVDSSPNPAMMLKDADNYFNFDITKYGNPLTKLYGVSDKDDLKEYINEFTQKFYADPPYIPLYFKTDNVFYGSYVSGMEQPNIFNPYKNVEKWFFYDKNGKKQKEQNPDETTDTKQNADNTNGDTSK